MKPDLSALHAFPWNEEEDLVFNVHACYGAVSNWGGIICLGLKWLSYKTPAVSWASQEWQGKEGCSEYWGELHCGGCGAKFALGSAIWNQVTAVLPSAAAPGGSCPKPPASPLQCVSEVHYHAAQNLMCVFQRRIQIYMSKVLTFLTDLFSSWDLSVTYTHIHCYKLQEKRDTKKTSFWFLNICKLFLTFLLYNPTVAPSNNRNDSTVPSNCVPTISFLLSHHHGIVYMQILNTA